MLTKHVRLYLGPGYQAHGHPITDLVKNPSPFGEILTAALGFALRVYEGLSQKYLPPPQIQLMAELGRNMEIKSTEQLARKPYLDGLRGVAALVVLFGHLLITLLPPVIYLGGGVGAALYLIEIGKTPLGMLWNGNAAVCVFFILSGYVLSDFGRHTQLSLFGSSAPPIPAPGAADPRLLDVRVPAAPLRADAECRDRGPYERLARQPGS
jgi:hypothetical protein